MTPKRNCLKCKFYDTCEMFDDGSCLLVERKGVEKHECYGFSMTAPQWGEFLKVGVPSVNKAIREGKMEELFERCVSREYEALVGTEKGPAGRPPATYTFAGKTRTIKEWADLLGVTKGAINAAIKNKVFDKRYKQRLAERGVL